MNVDRVWLLCRTDERGEILGGPLRVYRTRERAEQDLDLVAAANGRGWILLESAFYEDAPEARRRVIAADLRSARRAAATATETGAPSAPTAATPTTGRVDTSQKIDPARGQPRANPPAAEGAEPSAQDVARRAARHWLAAEGEDSGQRP